MDTIVDLVSAGPRSRWWIAPWHVDHAGVHVVTQMMDRKLDCMTATAYITILDNLLPTAFPPLRAANPARLFLRRTSS